MANENAMKNDPLVRMMEKRKQMDARIQLLRNRRSVDMRKLDTRRKILAGAYLIKLLGGNLEKVGHKLVEAKMLQERDRGLFFVERDDAKSGESKH